MRVIYDDRFRKAQRLVEILLIGLVSIAIFAVIFAQSLRQERIGQHGRRLRGRRLLPTDGPIRMAQRWLVYYFAPRVQTEFVIAPQHLYQVMGQLTFFARGRTHLELQEALALPCRRSSPEEPVQAQLFLQPGWTLTPDFLAHWRLSSSDILTQARKFDRAFRPGNASSDLGLATQTFLRFRTTHDWVHMALGSRASVPELAPAPRNVPPPSLGACVFNDSDCAIRGHLVESDDPESCYRQFIVPMEHPNYYFVAFHHKATCNYLDLLEELATLDWVDLLHRGPHSGISVHVSLTPSAVRSTLNLNLPLQALRAVDMFSRTAAQFDNIFECAEKNRDTSVRDVIHETELRLLPSSFKFRTVRPEEELPHFTLCGKYLFFIVDEKSQSPIVFGEKAELACAS